MVRGCKIDFTSTPVQHSARETRLNELESSHVDIEIKRLLDKGVLKKVPHVTDEFISTVFLRPKPDNTHRMILNLKLLNGFVEYKHFKMEHLNNAILSMTPDCYMGSIDLQDAYYTVPMDESCKKFMRFVWRGDVMEYQSLAFGLSSAPRLFTKLMKPIFAKLRGEGYVSVAYIDDSYLQGTTIKECKDNIDATFALLTKLGFVVNIQKSELEPKQQITFLGFILNSQNMTVRVTEKKSKKLRQKISDLQAIANPSIRQVSEVIGLMVAYSIAVPHGRLFAITLERAKIQALKYSRGNFEAKMSLTQRAYEDMNWWHDNISVISAPVRRAPPEIEMFTDASLTVGWGAVLLNTRTGGNWSATDLLKYEHINQLELFAVLLALKSFISQLQNKHVKLHIDNTTAVACINHFGSTRSEKCNEITRDIWMLAIKHDMWLTSVHIKGTRNISADMESRKLRNDTEWMLCSNIFKKISDLYFRPDIDMFASRINHQVDKYISWLPDPEAFMIDALSMSWKQFNNLYIFCPFSMIHRVVQKILCDKVCAILVVPEWPTASWYPLIMKMCLKPPRMLPRTKYLLKLPQQPDRIHPLHPKLRLMACLVSGECLQNRAYQRQQFLLL